MPGSLAAKERKRQVVELREQGLTYRQIADKLGYKSHSSVAEVVKRAYAEREAARPAAIADQAVVKQTDDLVARELQLLEAELKRLTELDALLTKRFMQLRRRANKGKPITTGPFVRIVEQLRKLSESRLRVGESRRKLLGIDQPTRFKWEPESIDWSSVPDDVFDRIRSDSKLTDEQVLDMVRAAGAVH